MILLCGSVPLIGLDTAIPMLFILLPIIALYIFVIRKAFVNSAYRIKKGQTYQTSVFYRVLTVFMTIAMVGIIPLTLFMFTVIIDLI